MKCAGKNRKGKKCGRKVKSGVTHCHYHVQVVDVDVDMEKLATASKVVDVGLLASSVMMV